MILYFCEFVCAHMNVSLHGPLYVKARTALDKKMQDSSKAGKKSSRKPVNTLEPDDVRTIYSKSCEQLAFFDKR